MGIKGAALPQAMQEAALVSAETAAGAGEVAVSWWREQVAAGLAPQPVVRRPRFTRWRAVDVAAFWESFAAAGTSPSDEAAVRERATRASAAGVAARRRKAAARQSGAEVVGSQA